MCAPVEWNGDAHEGFCCLSLNELLIIERLWWDLILPTNQHGSTISLILDRKGMNLVVRDRNSVFMHLCLCNEAGGFHLDPRKATPFLNTLNTILPPVTRRRTFASAESTELSQYRYFKRMNDPIKMFTTVMN